MKLPMPTVNVQIRTPGGETIIDDFNIYIPDNVTAQATAAFIKRTLGQACVIADDEDEEPRVVPANTPPLTWEQLHRRATIDHLGLIPTFILGADPRPVREQVHERYIGGWLPMGEGGFVLDPATLVLSYPGDPPLTPLFKTKLRTETFVVYEHAYCMILQQDGSFEVARLD